MKNPPLHPPPSASSRASGFRDPARALASGSASGWQLPLGFSKAGTLSSTLPVRLWETRAPTPTLAAQVQAQPLGKFAGALRRRRSRLVATQGFRLLLFLILLGYAGEQGFSVHSAKVHLHCFCPTLANLRQNTLIRNARQAQICEGHAFDTFGNLNYEL